MDTPSVPADQVFVLRFCRDGSGRDLPDDDWGVTVSHANSRRRFHVDGVERGFEVVRKMLGVPVPGSPEAPK